MSKCHVAIIVTSYEVMACQIIGNKIFVRQIVQPNNKGNVKALLYRSLPEVSTQKGAIMQKAFPCHDIVLDYQMSSVPVRHAGDQPNRLIRSSL